jgi:hypothetical protein
MAHRKFEGRLSTLRKAFPWLARVYRSEKRVWLPGFIVSSIGVDEGTVKKMSTIEVDRMRVSVN